MFHSILERMHLGKVGYRDGVSVGMLARSGWIITYSVQEALGELGLDSRAEDRRDVADPPEGEGETVSPRSWDTPEKTKQMLFDLTVAVRPRTIVEIGVANGASTNAFLAALDLNEKGRLLSFDLLDACRKAVRPELASRWTFHVLRAGSKRALARQIAASLAGGPPIDVFFCDADFRTDWRMKEFSLVREFLAPGGFLILRGADTSPAASNFLKRKKWDRPVLLADQRTFTAFLQRPLQSEFLPY